ncbi:HAMP domain-containing histidine kinase [Paenibacillus sp. SC116]|uniref:sensor histidine kinase n=1 Tax=Paenibacillus sp. SC116 TaxID=2968986 RepID=UPI00215B758C|nr:HAMP domain-containing sensor histidine kinase [Paenibacillus sp. SC116]MCR8845832.1 HAMP domain-containing histidine kinase [Paenibacillus sp. SC116]
MKATRRLAWHYIRQWLFIAIALLISVVIAFTWIVDRMMALDMNRNFANHGINNLVDSISITNGQIQWDEQLMMEVKASGGWLQIADSNGQVLHEFFVPEDVPKKYKVGELVSYMHRKIPFPYDVYAYLRAIGDYEIMLVYGVKPDDEQFLDAWLEDPEQAKPMLKQASAWVQLLNAEGDELESWNKPKGIKINISSYELVLRATYEDQYGERVAFQYNSHSGNTWILRMPYSAIDAEPYVMMAGLHLYSESEIWMVGTGAVVLSMLILFVIMAWWESDRIGRPLAHFMRWAEAMSNHEYEEPRNILGKYPSLNRKGKLKRNYRIYSDVWQSLRTLSERLQESESEREKHERLREQWLTGLTHDLKTPLSSIIGYAHLLNASEYKWSEAERLEFTTFIQQKAERMDELIQDLNLTYQLKSNALPMDRVETEMNDWLSSILHELLPVPADAENTDAKIVFNPHPQPIMLNIDVRYFVRAVENVCMNAWIHNEPGTTVTVSIEQDETGTTILFKDDGRGMDEQAQQNLFQRYYRGTSTDTTDQGSGLGMAITKQLIEAHEGEASVQSQIGTGTTIRFYFPRN